MPSTNYAYVNGHFTPAAEARVGIADRGFLHGYGVFETMRVYGGRIFRAAAHMERLFAGLRALGIESPFTAEELRAICRALIHYNAISNGVARVYLTPDSTVATVRPRVFEPRRLTAIVSTVRVDPQLSRYKTANRLPYIMAQQQAQQAGVEEAVLLNPAGRVVELANSNLFIVKDGAVFTPPLADGPLPGVTRQAILELAPVTERSFEPEFLETADEVFATNSLIEVTPVTSWSRSFSVTERLATAYRQLVREELSR